MNLDAGHFTASNGSTTTNNSHDLYAGYANVAAKSIDYLGGKYTLTDNLSMSLFGAWTSKTSGTNTMAMPTTRSRSLPISH